MKFHVFHLDRLPPRRPAGSLEHGFVIESKPQLWHAAQVAFQFHRAQDLGAKDVACRGDEEVEGFDDIEENFVFSVSDAFAAP